MTNFRMVSFSDSLDSLREYQLNQLNKTIKYVREKSRFYTSRLSGTENLSLNSLDEISRLPFTEEKDLLLSADDFICVPASEISRVVSIFSSGTSGLAKKICFTTKDLALTIDYFASGMSRLAGVGDRTMICMPGKSEYGVARLLAAALEMSGGRPFIYGEITNPTEAARYISKTKPDCLVGIPVQILALAEHYALRYGENEEKFLKSILLSTDYAAKSLKDRIQRVFGCPVFNHYGSTEMGYGGALECCPGNGLHIRERDLFFEIIEPKSGRPSAQGEDGELVFTTLTRSGMPLLRYRTGDLACFLSESCECGQISSRISPPRRIHQYTVGVKREIVSLHMMDEKIFSNDRIYDYSAEFVRESNAISHLELTIWFVASECGICQASVRESVESVVPEGMKIVIRYANSDEPFPGSLGKRLFRYV
jgi:phenylacetate-coenzyme A ligase PaaK-like adenylate-forming protein